MLFDQGRAEAQETGGLGEGLPVPTENDTHIAGRAMRKDRQSIRVKDALKRFVTRGTSK